MKRVMGEITSIFDSPSSSTTRGKENNPKIAPPNAAAVGIPLFSLLYVEPSELLGHVARTADTNFDPGLGKEGTGAEHKGDVDSGVGSRMASLRV
jgi:hypothetical protein